MPSWLSNYAAWILVLLAFASEPPVSEWLIKASSSTQSNNTGVLTSQGHRRPRPRPRRRILLCAAAPPRTACFLFKAPTMFQHPALHFNESKPSFLRRFYWTQVHASKQSGSDRTFKTSSLPARPLRFSFPSYLWLRRGVVAPSGPEDITKECVHHCHLFVCLGVHRLQIKIIPSFNCSPTRLAAATVGRSVLHVTFSKQRDPSAPCWEESGEFLPAGLFVFSVAELVPKHLKSFVEYLVFFPSSSSFHRTFKRLRWCVFFLRQTGMCRCRPLRASLVTCVLWNVRRAVDELFNHATGQIFTVKRSTEQT